MRVVSCRFLGAAALLSLAAAAPAVGQDTPSPGGWVDPPTEIAPSADATTGAIGPVDARPSPSAEPEEDFELPPRVARPEPAAPRAEPPVRSAEPERAAPRPRTAARPEPDKPEPEPRRSARPADEPRDPPRAARPAEEPRVAPRAPERRDADGPRAAPRAPERREAAAPRFPQRQQTAQARAAKELAIDYLDFWSGPNALALEAHQEFYAPSIRYHGRDMSARALQEEKRRFARRWPDREYRPRLDTMRTSCAGAFCTIRSTFDYRAADPNRGRTASGTGILELGVSFAGSVPVIVSETSSVVRRGSDRTVSLEEAED